jgi:hypothetical protein
MESSGKWAPDTQSWALFMPHGTINRLLSVFISVHPCQDFILSFQLPASCSSLLATINRLPLSVFISVHLCQDFVFSPAPRSPPHFSLVFPRCFHATQKTEQSQLLIDGNTRPLNPWCFHLFPWWMKNEYRMEVTLPFPHGNTQPSVSMSFRRCFHDPEKD